MIHPEVEIVLDRMYDRYVRNDPHALKSFQQQSWLDILEYNLQVPIREQYDCSQAETAAKLAAEFLADQPPTA